jgi:hypothetical protein
VFTEPLLRNGLHNPVVPPLLGADDIENTASFIVACWAVFIELLPGNALIKSVTILLFHLRLILKLTFRPISVAKILYLFLISSACDECPAHLILLELIAILILLFLNSTN